MFRAIWIWCLQCFGFDPRGIFVFHDGRRWRHEDPIVIARRLWSVMLAQENLFPTLGDMVLPPVPFDADESRKLIASGIGDDMQRGYSEIARAVRQACQVKELSEGGLTELECAQLLDRFEAYLGDVKKNGSGSPISLRATELPAESPTNSGSDSGSTSTDSSLEPQESSASAPPLGMNRP